MAESPIGITEINNREHIAPTKTGDNIAAKRTAEYQWRSDGTWGRSPMPLIPDPYDAQDFSRSTSTVDIVDYYQGGLSGTKIATVTITYTDSTKNTITSVVKS